jgi:hypothetical protein
VCQKGKCYDFLGKGVISCVFFSALCRCRNSSRCRRRRGGSSRYCTSCEARACPERGRRRQRAPMTLALGFLGDCNLTINFDDTQW